MIRFPVLQPFKFYRAGLRTDGINFSNPDNIEWSQRDQSGVYSVPFFQPVQLIWNDFTTGLDFQVYVDATAYDYELESEAAGVITLATTELLVHGTNVYKRVYYNLGSSAMIADGLYRIKISAGEEVWYSEWLDVKGWGVLSFDGYVQTDLTFDHCVPFEYGHFENNYGAIFASSYKFKMMIPLRLYKPLTKAEKNVYRDDPGVMTTLQSVPTRAYEFETLPVPAWFAEKMQMAFNCSDLTLNKIAVNAEAIPEAEIVSTSDLFSIRGEVVLTGFNSDYYAEETEEAEGTELLSAWTDTDFETFTDTAKNISSAINTTGGDAIARSNNIWVAGDAEERVLYIIRYNLINSGRVLPKFSMYTDDIPGDVWNTSGEVRVNSGYNVMLFTFNYGTDLIDFGRLKITAPEGTNFSLIPSLKKIILS